MGIRKREKAVGHDPAHARLTRLAWKRARQSEPDSHLFAHLPYGRSHDFDSLCQVAPPALGLQKQVMILDRQRAVAQVWQRKLNTNVRFEDAFSPGRVKANLA